MFTFQERRILLVKLYRTCFRMELFYFTFLTIAHLISKGKCEVKNSDQCKIYSMNIDTESLRWVVRRREVGYTLITSKLFIVLEKQTSIVKVDLFHCIELKKTTSLQIGSTAVSQD